MRNIKKYTAFFLTIILCVSLMAPMYDVRAQDQNIHISTEEDLINLSKKCTLDSWSKNKKVILDNDINLSGVDFTPIPIFSGTFEGEGHTIQGLELTGNGSHQGLFRYVQEGAVIQNLNIKGNISPNGSKTAIGGIAGRNRGVIKNCTFSGTVSGSEYIGSIVGVNETSGMIIDCTVSGIIYGERYIGGIAGENMGTILRAVNNASVNTKVINQGLDVEKLMSEGMDLEENTSEIASDVTDIGGISGINKGIIQNCTNKGTIGYEHVGYNVGGIAGRQSGYITECSNYGEIYGRKDVGGIVGQMEPYTLLTYSKSKLDELSKELNTLQGMIQRATNNGQNGSDEISSQLTTIQGHVDTARSHTNSLIDQTESIIDQNVGTVNEISATVAEAIDRLIPVTDSLTEMATYMEETMEPMEDVLEYMDKVTDSTEDGIEELGDINDSMSSAIGDIDRAFRYFESSRSLVEEAVYHLSRFEVKSAVQCIREASDALGQGNSYLHEAMMNLKSTNDSLSKILDTLDNVNDDIRKAIKAVSEAVQVLEQAAHALTNTFTELGNLVQYLADQPEATFVVGDSQYEETKNNLSNALGETSSALGDLNQVVNTQSHNLFNDIQAITDQLFVVFDVMIGITEEITSYDISENREDISDNDTEAETEGKVANCINAGSVAGDINIGGIAGAMSIDRSFDPEDDIEVNGNKSLDFIFQTRAVIRACQSNGDIRAKKDSVGGIVGSMKMGYIVDSITEGKIVSSGGNYVGGIAGQSQSLIRSSYAKCNLEGGSYIGGIAGKGKDIIDSRALVHINEANEYFGSIAGDIEVDGKVKGNFFVNDTLGGIDGISYQNQAEPLVYEDFMQLDGIPHLFSEFTLKFWNEDVLVETIPFAYGDSLEAEKLPQVPEREGYYGRWESFDYNQLTFDQDIEAVYASLISTLESQERKDGTMPIVLVEGYFVDTDHLIINESKKPSPILEETDTQLEQWTVTIPTDGNATHTLRYLIPDSANHIQIHVLKDEEWVQVETKKDGKYVRFEVNGEEVVFSAISTEQIAIEERVIVVIGGMILLGVGIIRLKKEKKKHGASKSLVN